MQFGNIVTMHQTWWLRSNDSGKSTKNMKNAAVNNTDYDVVSVPKWAIVIGFHMLEAMKQFTVIENLSALCTICSLASLHLHRPTSAAPIFELF